MSYKRLYKLTVIAGFILAPLGCVAVWSGYTIGWVGIAAALIIALTLPDPR